MAKSITDVERLRKLQAELAKLSEDEVERRYELERLIRSIKADIESNLESQKEIVEKTEAEVKLIKDLINGIEEQYILNDKLLELENEKLKLKSVQLQNDYEAVVAAGNLTEEFEKQYLQQQKYIKSQRESLDLQEKALGFGRQMAKNLGVGRAEDSSLGLFFKDPSKFAEKAVSGFQDMMTPANVFISLMEKVVESTIFLAIAQDEATVSFNQTTGAFMKYDAELRNISSRLATAGISAGDSAKAFTALFKEVKDFSELEATMFNFGANRVSITETTALLEKMGISADISAKNIVFLTKSMGMNIQEASRFNTRLLSLARDLNLSVDQVASDFEKARPILGAVGGDTARVFADLQRTVKATNLELDKILDITSKFDTFDSAAQSVGRLNALMGGPYLSTLQLIEEVDPAARFQMISEAVQDAAGSFESLSYYEKKAYADALGLQDVNDLALVLSGNMDTIKPPEMDTQSIIEMKLQMVAFNTVMDELKNAGMSLAIGLGPFVTILKGLLKIFEFFGPLISYTVMGFYALRTATAASEFVLSILSGSWLTLGSSIDVANAALIRQKAAMVGTIVGVAILGFGVLTWLSGFGKAITVIASAMFMLAGAFILYNFAEKGTTLFGGAIGLIISGLSMLATCIMVGCSPALIVAIAALGVAVIGLGLAFEFAQPLVWPVIAAFSILAVAATLLGLGVMMAGKGAEFMASAFERVATVLLGEGGAQLPMLVSQLASSLLYLGFVGLMSAGPILALGYAMIPFGAGLMLASLGVSSMAQSIDFLATGLERIGSALNALSTDVFMGVAQGIAQMNEELENLPVAKTLAVTALVAAATPAALALGPAAMAATSAGTAFGATVASSAVNNTSATSTTQNVNNTSISSINQQTGQNAVPNLNVTLVIDGEQIRTVVNKVKVDRSKSPELYNSIAKMITKGGESA